MILGWLTDFAMQCWPFLGLALLFLFGGLLWPNKFWTTSETWAGVGCYVASFFFATAYLHAEDRPTAIAIWQIGLIATLIMYASMVSWQARNAWNAHFRHGMAIVVGVLCAVGFIRAGFAPLIEPAGTRRGAEMVGFVMIVLLVATVLWNLPRPSPTSYILPTAHLVWMVVLVAETWAAWEYLDCKILSPDVYNLNERWGVDVAKMACQREWGGLYPWVQQILTGSAIVAILIWHHRRLRPWAY